MCTLCDHEAGALRELLLLLLLFSLRAPRVRIYIYGMVVYLDVCASVCVRIYGVWLNMQRRGLLSSCRLGRARCRMCECVTEQSRQGREAEDDHYSDDDGKQD